MGMEIWVTYLHLITSFRFLTASFAAVLYVTFRCTSFWLFYLLLVWFYHVPFWPVLVCPITHWKACFASNSAQLSSAQLNSTHLSWTQLSSILLNSAQHFLYDTAGSQVTTGRSVYVLWEISLLLSTARFSGYNLEKYTGWLNLEKMPGTCRLDHFTGID